MRNFKDIKQSDQLDNKDFYRFLQIRHNLDKLNKTDADRPVGGMITIFIRAYKSLPNEKINLKIVHGIAKH